MEQYKITSADFFTPGETGETDAMIDMDELNKAAGKSKMSAFLQQASADAVIDMNSAEQINIIREQRFENVETNSKRIS